MKFSMFEFFSYSWPFKYVFYILIFPGIIILNQVNHLPNQLNWNFYNSRKYPIFASKQMIQHFFLMNFWMNFTGFVMTGTFAGSDHCNIAKRVCKYGKTSIPSRNSMSYRLFTLYTCQVYSTEVAIRNLLMNVMLGDHSFKQNKYNINWCVG